MISSDGLLHVMGLMTGKDLQRPTPFVPADSRWSDPIAVGTMLYTTTSGGCGGAPNAIWAIDLESADKPVVSWKSGGPIVGSLAFTSDGTLVAAVPRGNPVGFAGANIVMFDTKPLRVKSGYTSPDNSAFATGPTIFKYGDRELIAAAIKSEGGTGHILLFDPASPVGPNRPKAFLDTSNGPGDVATDSLATWEQMTSTPRARWILEPTEHSVLALRLDDTHEGISAPVVWTASNLTAPTTPIIVNGVVFVLEAGRGGSSAVLHAFEGTTGKELWSSGKTMTAPAAPGSFWSAFGQVYVGTMDGTLYAFGFNDERR
jgi:hypothetical protein